MKNKIALLLILLFLAAPVYAMPYSRFELFVSMALLDYLENQEQAALTIGEIRQLVSFYFSIPEGTTEVTLSPEIEQLYLKFTECIPDYTRKECGYDGCVGSCGTCSAGESCHNNKCIASAKFEIITPSELPVATEGNDYYMKFEAVNGQEPYSYSASNVPAGLRLSEQGALRGAPKSYGTYTIDVEARDSQGNVAQKSFTLEVGCAGTCPVCGNGILEEGEECDDGNNADGDGCSSDCRIEGTGIPQPVPGVIDLEGAGGQYMNFVVKKNSYKIFRLFATGSEENDPLQIGATDTAPWEKTSSVDMIVKYAGPNCEYGVPTLEDYWKIRNWVVQRYGSGKSYGASCGDGTEDGCSVFNSLSDNTFYYFGIALGMVDELLEIKGGNPQYPDYPDQPHGCYYVMFVNYDNQYDKTLSMFWTDLDAY
jgi:cysteine-rich repeat protein